MIKFIKDKFLDCNLFFYLTLLLIPVSVGLSSVTLALSFIYALISFLIHRNVISLKRKRYLIMCFILYLYVISNTLFFTKEIGFNSNILLKYLPVLFIPIYDIGIRRGQKENVETYKFEWLFLGITLSLIIGVFRCCYYDYSYNYSNIENIFKVHPAYISMFILICINHLFYSNNRFKFLLLLIFIISIIFIRSRTSTFVLVVVVCYNLFMRLKNKWQKITLVFIAIVGFILLMYNINSVDQTKTSLILALNERLQIWGSSFKLFLKAPIFGLGFGNEYLELSYSYFLEAKYNLLDNGYNSHNIFLSQLVQSGIVGLLLMAGVFIFPMFNRAIRQEYFGFLIIISICGFTESYMYRHWGVIPILICGLYVSSLFKKYNNS